MEFDFNFQGGKDFRVPIGNLEAFQAAQLRGIKAD
jgi:hypothetical protein